MLRTNYFVLSQLNYLRKPMEIRRFFVDKSMIQNGKVTLTGDEFLHMTKVLRYRVGFKAIVCANDGIENLCTIEEIGKDFAVLHVDESTVVDKKSVNITLFAGLLKNNKLSRRPSGLRKTIN